MISMEKLDNGNVADTLDSNTIVVNGVNGLSYLMNVSITDLDPKCPKTMKDLERKWRDKDVLLVHAYKKKTNNV